MSIRCSPLPQILASTRPIKRKRKGPEFCVLACQTACVLGREVSVVVGTFAFGLGAFPEPLPSQIGLLQDQVQVLALPVPSHALLGGP